MAGFLAGTSDVMRGGVSPYGDRVNRNRESLANAQFRDRFDSSSSAPSSMTGAFGGISASPVYGYSNALNQHLSSNQTPYGGDIVNTGGGVGGAYDPSRPDTGYSSPTGNYPEPGWPDPGGAETPTYPTPSPTTPTTIPPIYSPNTPSPSGGLPPVEIESLSFTPPGSGFNFSMPNFEIPEISRMDIPDAGPFGFYSVNEGGAGWSGRGGYVDDLDRFVAREVGGPDPVRFRAAFG